MKHTLHPVLVCSALASLPLITQAGESPSGADNASESGWFVGAGVGGLDYQESGIPDSRLTYLFLQGGWRFNRYLSLDARVGTSISGVEYDFDIGTPVDLKLDSLYGVYARAIAPIGSKFDVFAVAGYTAVKLKASASGIGSVSDTGSSLSWGVGASWNFAPQASLDLEYLPTTVKGDGWKSSGMNLSYRLRF